MKTFIEKIVPVEKPHQFAQAPLPDLTAALVEAEGLIRAKKGRDTFRVSGNGLTVAVLDTGLRVSHTDFAGKVLAQVNYTTDYGGTLENADDQHGHGTNVGGIIVAKGIHTGIAPGANIIPIKVLTNSGGGSFQSIIDALQWVLDNHATYNISAICMSLGDGGNYRMEAELAGIAAVKDKIAELRSRKIASVVAAGNDFFRHNSIQGMAYPAIIKEVVSVGAVYDENEGPMNYRGGAKAFTTEKDRITP